MPNHAVASTRRLSAFLLPGLLAWVAACASAPEGPPPESEPFVPPEDPEPDSIGFVLTRLDNDLKAWTNLKLNAESNADLRKLRGLERRIAQEASRRSDELLAQLESRAPTNRAIAAVALGFTGDEAVVGPLLNALNDPDDLVPHNALIGLGVLASPATPLGRICFVLENHPDGFTRVNAAYAVSAIVGAGGRDEGVEEACLTALDDPEGGVRAQAATALARMRSVAAIPGLGDLLYDEHPLVARAAAAGLATIALEHLEETGRVARLMVDAAARRKPTMRAFILAELRRLSTTDWGDEMEDWTDWAYRLP